MKTNIDLELLSVISQACLFFLYGYILGKFHQWVFQKPKQKCEKTTNV